MLGQNRKKSQSQSLYPNDDDCGYGSINNQFIRPTSEDDSGGNFPNFKEMDADMEHPGTLVYCEGRNSDNGGSQNSITVQLRKTMEPKYIKMLLIFVPIAIVLFYFGPQEKKNSGLVSIYLFILSFLGIIPLAAILGDFTEDLALHTNDVIGALINVTFGNATELIICIFALRAGYFNLIKMSLLGSVFGNMLLVLGMSMIICGTKHKVICFNSDAANTYIPLLTLAVFSFTIPAGYEMSFPSSSDIPVSEIAKQAGFAITKLLTSEERNGKVLLISRLIAGIDCVVYALYLYFQLHTHRAIFDKKNEYTQNARRVSIPFDKGTVFTNVDDDEDEGPQFSAVYAILGVVIVSILLSILSSILVDSIMPAADAMGLTQDFIGFILVPIIGNAAEHSTAGIMAYKGKMDIVVSVALGSAIQIGLLMMPFLVVVGGVLDLPLDMNFHPFAVGILLVSVLVTAHTVGDGRTNWLEGVMLLSVYVMTGILFFVGHVPLNGD